MALSACDSCAFRTRLSSSVGAGTASAAHRVAATRGFSLGRIALNLPASWMGSSAALCPSAQHAVTSLDGPRAVRQRLHLSAEGEAVWEGRVRNGHTPCTAVRASDAFDDWGVLDRGTRCTTCNIDYYNCEHAQELSRLAEGGAAAVGWCRVAPQFSHRQSGWGSTKHISARQGRCPSSPASPSSSCLRTLKAIRNSSPPAKVTRGFCMLTDINAVCPGCLWSVLEDHVHS